MSITELRPQEDVPLLAEHLENSKKGKGFIEFGKFNHIKKNGELIIAEIYGYRMEFDHRPCTLILSKDITYRENVIKRLKKKSSNLLTAEKIAKLGYWEFNLNEKSFYWSAQIYKIWGRKRTYKPTLKKLIKSVHIKDKKTVLKFFSSSTINQLQSFETEFRILSSKGTEKWIQCRGNLLKHNGHPFFEGTFQDITEKKHFLEKIVQSEARYKNLVNTQSSYVIRTDFSGNYTYCNQTYQEEFKWLFINHDVLQCSILKSIHNYHHQRVIEKVQECIKQPNVVLQLEIDKCSQDGEIKNTLWEMICLTNSEGEPREIQWVGLNITARVKAEKALKESNTRYSLVSKATSDAIWDWDSRTNQLIWGEGFEILFGYKADLFSIRKDSWQKYLHPEDSLKTLANINKAIEGTGTKWQAKYRFKKADGNYANVIDRGFILRDENNNVLRIVGSMQDITTQKKLKRLLNTASSLAKVGSFELDGTAKKVFASAMVRKILGIDSNFALHYRNCTSFFKDRKDLRLILSSIKKAFNDNISFDHKLQILTNRGEERWVRIIGIPEIINGKCFCVNGSFQDIDEIKKAELQVQKSYEKLVVANKGLEQFTFIVSHNLRAPVANIIGLGDLLSMVDHPRATEKELIKNLIQNVKRLDDVIKDLNEILQVQKDVNLKKEQIDLEDFIQSIALSISRLLNEEQVKIYTDFTNYCQMTTVKGYLHSIFLNLITNSIKYRTPGKAPIIKIRSKKSEDGLTIYFKDNGIGMDIDSQKNHLFKLYRRFHSHVEGKGMGLFMIKTQVELLGGKIEVQSQINKGTEFKINFPQL